MINLTNPYSQSLFTQVTSRMASPYQDPRENRLTEVFASVLDRVAALPQALMEFWYEDLVPPGGEFDSYVQTQRPSGGDGFVDLAITLRPRRRLVPEDAKGADSTSTLRDIVCWIEVKHRDPPPALHGVQLHTYLRDIQAIGAATRFVRLLVPRGFDPEDIPVAVDYGTWQELARWLYEYEKKNRAVELSEADSFLIRELLHFLQEEDLMDANRLTAQHAFIADAVPASYSTFTALWDNAEGVIFKDWKKPHSGGLRQLMNMFRVFDLKPPEGDIAATWRGNYLEWGMRPDDFLGVEARRSLVFFAGLTVSSSPKPDPLFKLENRPWLDALEGVGFRQVTSYYPRLWRLRYVDELLTLPTLEAQGQELGRWVVDSFKEICRVAPPA